MLSAADRNLDDVKRQFGDWGLVPSWLAPTRTALKKSTIDAIAPFRLFLKANDLHDYQRQAQGPKHKITLPALFVLPTHTKTSTASLYRPKSGNGDPRIWFPGLESYAKPNNVIAVVPVPEGLALINASRRDVLESAYLPGSPLSDLIERRQQSQIENSPVSVTEKEQLIQARVGQGRFRRRLEHIEKACRITRVAQLPHLRASHIKPWKSSNNAEKLDPNNGLLLAPHIDHLFDQGWISFADSGEILVAPSLKPNILHSWGINRAASAGTFSPEQRKYLAYHRKYVLRR